MERERDSRRYNQITDGHRFDEPELLRLVRELKRVGASQEVFVPPLIAACEGLGVQPADAVAMALDVWDGAVGPGEDVLTRLASEAVARPIDFPGVPAVYHFEASHRQILTLAYLLELHHGERPGFFPFGAKAVGERIDLHRHTVGKIIRRMDADGLVRLRRDFDGRPSFSHLTGDSYSIRYTGPRPNEGGSAATYPAAVLTTAPMRADRMPAMSRPVEVTTQPRL